MQAGLRKRNFNYHGIRIFYKYVNKIQLALAQLIPTHFLVVPLKTSLTSIICEMLDYESI